MISLPNTQIIADKIREGKNISVFGMPFFSRPFALAPLDGYLYVCADYIKAGEIFKQICSMRDDAVYIPPLDDVLIGAKSGAETTARRAAALGRLADGSARVGVTTVWGYLQLYPLLSDVKNHIIYLKAGEAEGVESVIKKLVAAGYRRTEQIESVGQFSARGGILDVWGAGHSSAFRLDFFGDEIEEIKLLDVDSQLSKGDAGAVVLYPFIEAFPPENISRMVERIKESIPKKLEPEYLARIQFIVEGLVQRLENNVKDASLNILKPLLNQTSVSTYFKNVIFDEAKQCADSLSAHLTEHRNRFKSLLERGETLGFSINQLHTSLMPSCTVATFDKILCQNRIFKPQEVLNFSGVELASYAKDRRALIDDIKIWQGRGINVSLFCKEPLATNLKDFLLQNGVSPALVASESPLKSLYRGGCFFEDNRIIIAGGDLTLRRDDGAINPSLTKGRKNKKEAFFQPTQGQHIVHNVHGIGMCEGLNRMAIGGAERDFCVLRYEGGDRVYVSVENMNMLSAYAGEENPKLNRLGGAEFARVKERVKKAIKEMAFDLQKLYASRQALKGHAFNPDNSALAEFEAEFPYEETPCQLTAAAEGIKDLTSGKVMDRLLCGDVGYGKTEVAMRLIYKVVLEGKQAAFIAPTTILARQHFESLKKRMAHFGVNIGSLTRFESASALAATIKGLKSGAIDVAVGTHRILSKDVAFKDLGLLVLDEEQRFGVADKEKIKLLKNDVNVLSLSATPIPRTLHMAMSGIRDISVLDTAPPSRIPVATFVSEYTDTLLSDAVRREANRGGQCFIVYNRVETMDNFAAKVAALFPDLKCAIAHGQMEQRRLENALNDFLSKKTDILITSTIIENGIDIPSVNTMIVIDSDRFGLSQLYQLRGRIGRGGRLAYAFFTFDGTKTLTENAYKRLDALTSYTELGSGFRLAVRDLEIRGAGNVLGREQHGHMTKVGYDMYLKLMDEVMDEINGESLTGDIEIKVSTDRDAFIPEDYIESIEGRLKAYKRIADISSSVERAEELADLTDIYGAPSESVLNLLDAALAKNLAKKAGATRVILRSDNCGIVFPTSDIPLSFLRQAIDAGFFYSAAENSLTFKPPATDKSLSSERLIKFLES